MTTGYFLLWGLALAAAWSLVAWVMALVMPVTRPVFRRLPPALVFLSMLAVLAVLTGAGFLAWVARLEPSWLLPWLASLTGAFALGGLIIMLAGNRRASRRSGRLWPRGKLFLLPVVFAVGATATGWWISQDEKNTNDEIRSAATARGAALLPRPSGDEPNALDEYQKAFAAMGHLQALPPWFFENPDHWDPGSADALDLVRRQVGPLRLASLAAGRPVYFQSIDPERLLEAPAINYAPYQTLARLLALSAMVQARLGDAPAAWKEIDNLDRMTGHLRRRPAFISLLAAATMEKTRIAALEYVLNQDGEIPESAGTAPFDPAPLYQPALERTMAFEGAGIVQYVAGIGAEGRPSFRAAVTLSTPAADQGRFGVALLQSALYYFWPIPLRPRDVAMAQRKAALLEQDAATPFYRFFQEGAPSDQNPADEPVGLVTGLVTPRYAVYYRLVARGETYHRLGTLALACAAYRKVHDEYPDGLERLIPEFLTETPLDPFDGQPLKLRRDEGRLIISSVGEPQEQGGTGSGPIQIELKTETP